MSDRAVWLDEWRPTLPSRAPCAVSGVGPEEDQAACVLANRALLACSFAPDV